MNFSSKMLTPNKCSKESDGFRIVSTYKLTSEWQYVIYKNEKIHLFVYTGYCNFVINISIIAN